MMKKKLVAGFMAATMVVSVMTTGVFARDLDPTNETQRMGSTEVTATVEEKPNKVDYTIRIPDTVDFGTIQQPETGEDAYTYKDITVECAKADNLEAGKAIAVLVKDANADKPTDQFLLTHNTNKDCVLAYEIMNNDVSIQNNTWYHEGGFLFNLFTKADQSATDQLRLNRSQLYNKDFSAWGGAYTGTLNFYTMVKDINVQ